jgi:hypothetical protein
VFVRNREDLSARKWRQRKQPGGNRIQALFFPGSSSDLSDLDEVLISVGS